MLITIAPTAITAPLSSKNTKNLLVAASIEEASLSEVVYLSMLTLFTSEMTTARGPSSLFTFLVGSLLMTRK